MDLGNKVKLRREQLGMSQEELAFKMGYKSRTSINKIENGRPVSQKIIVRLAEVLQVSVHYLMGWEEKNPFIVHTMIDGAPITEAVMAMHGEQNKKPATENGSGLHRTGYDQLSPENKSVIDGLIEKLLKSQSGE